MGLLKQVNMHDNFLTGSGFNPVDNSGRLRASRLVFLGLIIGNNSNLCVNLFSSYFKLVTMFTHHREVDSTVLDIHQDTYQTVIVLIPLMLQEIKGLCST